MRLWNGRLYLEQELPELDVLAIVGLLAAAIVYASDVGNPRVSDWQRARVLELPGFMGCLVRGDYQVADGLAYWKA